MIAFIIESNCVSEYALTAALRDFGVVPDVVIGHSVGVVAAQFAVGHLTFEEAVEVIYKRRKLL